ncbi:MAG: energy transducer TonB, partial [Verrucomicrobiota bacterium]
PLIYKKLGAKAEQEFKDSLETKKSTDVLTARPVGGWEIFSSGLANKIYETDPTAEGKLKIRLVVDSSGKVTRTKVVEGFNEEANKTIIQTIEKTKFHPSRKNGKVQEMSTSLVMVLQKRG